MMGWVDWAWFGDKNFRSELARFFLLMFISIGRRRVDGERVWEVLRSSDAVDR